jgi:hypothetical protein
MLLLGGCASKPATVLQAGSTPRKAGLPPATQYAWSACSSARLGISFECPADWYQEPPIDGPAPTTWYSCRPSANDNVTSMGVNVLVAPSAMPPVAELTKQADAYGRTQWGAGYRPLWNNAEPLGGQPTYRRAYEVNEHGSIWQKVEITVLPRGSTKVYLVSYGAPAKDMTSLQPVFDHFVQSFNLGAETAANTALVPDWARMMRTVEARLGQSKGAIVSALGAPERAYGLEYWYHPPDWTGATTLQNMGAPRVGIVFTEARTVKSVYRSFDVGQNAHTQMTAGEVWSFLGATSSVPEGISYDDDVCLYYENQHPGSSWYTSGLLTGKSAQGNALVMEVNIWQPPAVSKKHFDTQSDKWVVERFVHNPAFDWRQAQVIQVGIFKKWPVKDDRFHTLQDEFTIRVE